MNACYNHSIAAIILFAAMFTSPIQLNAQSITWIGPFPGGFFISDVSDDGNIVVGNFGNLTLNASIASRWTIRRDPGLRTLPDRNNSNAKAVSSDGNVVVGYSYDDTSYTAIM